MFTDIQFLLYLFKVLVKSVIGLILPFILLMVSIRILSKPLVRYFNENDRLLLNFYNYFYICPFSVCFFFVLNLDFFNSFFTESRIAHSCYQGNTKGINLMHTVFYYLFIPFTILKNTIIFHC